MGIDRQTSRAIDSLRVICCAVVVASHLYEFSTGQVNNYWNESISYIAVAVFFFLSGYVNQVSYSAKPDYRAFLLSRWRRLAPLYYLAVVVSLALAALLGVLAPTDWLNLIFLQSIAVPTVITNGPLWSLAWEFVLYLAFPLLAGFVRSPIRYVVPLVVLVILFSGHVWLLVAFLMGIGCAFYGVRFPRLVFYPVMGRWTYEIYLVHYPLLVLGLPVFASLPSL